LSLPCSFFTQIWFGLGDFSTACGLFLSDVFCFFKFPLCSPYSAFDDLRNFFFSFFNFLL
jgi:hypothetical protein